MMLFKNMNYVTHDWIVLLISWKNIKYLMAVTVEEELTHIIHSVLCKWQVKVYVILVLISNNVERELVYLVGVCFDNLPLSVSSH